MKRTESYARRCCKACRVQQSVGHFLSLSQRHSVVRYVGCTVSKEVTVEFNRSVGAVCAGGRSKVMRHGRRH